MKEKEVFTECQKKMKELREETGMNRKEFCEQFDIPYRTVTEWERGNRNAPGYVLRFMEYYIAMEKVKERSKQKDFFAEEFETKRLWIRHFKKEDAESCYQGWGKDERLGSFILSYPMNLSQMEDFVEEQFFNENSWVIVEKESGNCIGFITVTIPYTQLGIGEAGYVIGEHYQRKGYAYEAVNRMLQHYLVERDLYMIEAKYQEKNTASARLLKKLGFKVDGTLRNRRVEVSSGERKNLVVCSITGDEYKEKNAYEEK